MAIKVDTLVDTGPLIALLSRSDSYHIECSRLFRELNCPFYTTLPVITEAMYFLQKLGGGVGQNGLWKLLNRGDLLLIHPEPKDLLRMEALMNKYDDRQMDFADASIVSIAERMSLHKVFTTDIADFNVYRLKDRKPFTIIGPST